MSAGASTRCRRTAPTDTSHAWTGFLSKIGAESLPALADEIGRSHGESGRLRLLVSMPYGKAWELLETQSDAFRNAYWEKVEFGPGRYPAGDLHELVDRLLEVGRPLAALQAVSLDRDAVESSRLTKAAPCSRRRRRAIALALRCKHSGYVQVSPPASRRDDRGKGEARVPVPPRTRWKRARTAKPGTASHVVAGLVCRSGHPRLQSGRSPKGPARTAHRRRGTTRRYREGCLRFYFNGSIAFQAPMPTASSMPSR